MPGIETNASVPHIIFVSLGSAGRGKEGIGTAHCAKLILSGKTRGKGTKQLSSGHGNEKITAWNARTGGRLPRPDSCEAEIFPVPVSPGGKRIHGGKTKKILIPLMEAAAH